jgi:acetolactate synthase-like protein
MAESPLLLMGGAAATLLKGRGALQDIDQMALFRPICKYCVTIRRLCDIVPTLRLAIQTAMSGTPGACACSHTQTMKPATGPVFIEFPIDVLYPYPTVYKELGVVPNPRSIMQRVINQYLCWHVARLFARAFVGTDEVSPLPPSVPQPTAAHSELCTFCQ